MSTLSELASVFRSKNAGPFLITIDLIFADREGLDTVLNSASLTATEVAHRYGVDVADVTIIPMRARRELS